MSNAYAIYLSQENSPEKSGLMLYSLFEWHHLNNKDLSVKDEHASH